MSLELLEHGLTDAIMFTAEGEVVQPSEVLFGKPVVIERGAFRPVTNVTKEMLDSTLSQYYADPSTESGGPVVLMEMTLNNLMTKHAIDHADFPRSGGYAKRTGQDGDDLQLHAVRPCHHLFAQIHSELDRDGDGSADSLRDL
jgi:hypothetical protein